METTPERPPPTRQGPAPGPPFFSTRPSPSADSLFHHLTGYFNAVVKQWQLRAQLALMEAREAGSHYGTIAGLFIGALVLALFGYIFLIITAVFGIAAAMHGPHDWIIVMGGAALLHLIVAAVMVFMARARLKTGLFAATKEQFKKEEKEEDHG